MNYNDNDVLTMARTLYGEARGEPELGKIAVAWVIRNRAERRQFVGPWVGMAGATQHACQMPWQFSCWNESDPNRQIIAELPPNQMISEMFIAGEVLAGAEADPTNGADHYHTIAKPAWATSWPPSWAPAYTEVARFGGHVFYDSRLPRKVAA